MTKPNEQPATPNPQDAKPTPQVVLDRKPDELLHYRIGNKEYRLNYGILTAILEKHDREENERAEREKRAFSDLVAKVEKLDKKLSETLDLLDIERSMRQRVEGNLDRLELKLTKKEKKKTIKEDSD